MKRYIIAIARTSYEHIEVEAENEDDAEEKAWAAYKGNKNGYVFDEISDIQEVAE